MAEAWGPPSASGDAIALLAASARAIGGVNQLRTNIKVTSNDSTQTIWLWVQDTPAGSSAPTAATVKAKGEPLLPNASTIFRYGLYSNGAGGTTPTIWGVADMTDQVLGTKDTRWSEGGGGD